MHELRPCFPGKTLADDASLLSCGFVGCNGASELEHRSARGIDESYIGSTTCASIQYSNIHFNSSYHISGPVSPYCTYIQRKSSNRDPSLIVPYARILR